MSDLGRCLWVADSCSSTALSGYKRKVQTRERTIAGSSERAYLPWVCKRRTIFLNWLKTKPPCNPALPSRMTKALMDSLGPEWRLKLPSIPVVPVSAQKKWNSLPSGKNKETTRNKPKETTTKSKGEL